MAKDTPDTVGARVALARKRRSVTQVGLAERSRYSRSHIASVETGARVPTPAFVSAVARALGVTEADLYGQPYRDGHDDHVHAAIPELRRILVYVDVGPDLDHEARSLDTLAAEVATMRHLMHQAAFTKLGGRLPGVIEELAWWTNETGDARAWTMLSRALREGGSLTRRLGYGGDALALLNSADVAARHSGDPHAGALVTLARSLLLMGMDQYGPALTLLDRAMGNVDEGRPDGAELAGAIELRSAIIAARAARGSDDTTAWSYWGSAADRIKTKPPEDARHGLEFTPGNVAIHGAAVATEMGDMDEAARRDQGITEQTLGALPPERRAHHEIDMSRVQVELGGHDQALARLLAAETTAPQMTRFHPSAQSVARHLGDVRRTLPEPLRGLLGRMHVYA